MIVVLRRAAAGSGDEGERRSFARLQAPIGVAVVVIAVATTIDVVAVGVHAKRRSHARARKATKTVVAANG